MVTARAVSRNDGCTHVDAVDFRKVGTAESSSLAGGDSQSSKHTLRRVVDGCCFVSLRLSEEQPPHGQQGTGHDRECEICVVHVESPLGEG